jgi:hypothetical protein
MSTTGNGSSPGPLRPGSPARRLPHVLRQLAAGKADNARLQLGTVTAIPDADSVTLDFGGGTVTVPRIAGYTPTIGEPAWCLAGETTLLALGAVGGTPGGTTYTLPPRLQPAGPIFADANAINESGWYRANGGGGINTPNPYGMLFHQAWDAGNGHAGQLFWPMNSPTELWHRACNTYAWKPWVKIAPIDDGNLPARLRSLAAPVPGNDWNQAHEDGWYAGDGNAGVANCPTATWIIGTAMQPFGDGSYVVQNVTELYGSLSFQRRKVNGAWGAWAKTFPIDDAGLPARLGSAGANVTDWNLATQDGYYTSGSAPNAPVQGYFMIGHVTTGSGGVVQDVWMRDYPNRYQRAFNGSTWSKWQQLVECISAGTIRKTIGGYATGTLDGNGHAVIPFGRTVVNVAGVLVTNGHQGKLNTIYSASGFTAASFMLMGWAITNVPDANAPYAVSWLAIIDE